MIHSRITAKAQTTVPLAVRRALGIGPGDEVVWELDGEQVKVRRIPNLADPFDNPFANFTEWATEADCKAFDDL